MILLLLAGIVTAFNYIILMKKLKNKRYKSFFFDLFTFIILQIVFLGTFQGMLVAMISSGVLSIWSWFYIK